MLSAHCTKRCIVIFAALLALDLLGKSFSFVMQHRQLFKGFSRSLGKRRLSVALCAEPLDGGGDPPKLIVGGEDLKKNLEELQRKYPTSEAAYLAASKKRAEEYQQRKADAEARGEWDEVEGADAALASTDGNSSRDGSDTNYGPGKDLSSYNIVDDGFEASVGNDGEMAPLLTTGDDEGSEDNDDPKLLIPDEDSNGDDQTLLL